jgi:hypothetical protein
MRNALLVVSGVSIGLVGALFAGATREAGLRAAEAQAGPSGGTGASGPTFVVSTGGATPNQNDLCWITQTEKAKNRQGQEYERMTLTLYKASNNGTSFDLVDTRDITYDAKVAQLNLPGHNGKLTPKEMKKIYDEERRKEEEERQREASRPRNP